MVVLALVLIVLGVAVGVVGVLATMYRLPRNRVVGVRTPWTMSRVDAFRRANHAAAPAFVAAGVIGTVGGAGSALSGSTAAAITLLVVGALGSVLLVGVAGTIGVRFAEAEETSELSAVGPAGPCTVDADTGSPGDADDCVPGACGGICTLCPRGSDPHGTAQRGTGADAPTT